MSGAFSLDASVLDSAPARWARRPLWTVVRRREVTGRPALQLLSVYRDHGVVPRSSRDDNFNRPGEDLGTYRYVRPGDLVLNKMKAWQGSLGVSLYEGIVSPAYFVCELSPEIEPRYAHHLLRSQPYIHLYQAASKGIRPHQWDLPFDEFRRLPMLLPPLDEQRRIADFLDVETARLDRLAEQFSRLAGLAAERARAVVDAAFARFPPDSMVPVSAVCRAIADCVNKTAPVSAAATPYRMIRTSNIRNGEVDLTDTFSVAREVFVEWNRRGAPRRGDVLFTREAPLGQAGMLRSDAPVFLGQRVMLYRADERLIRKELLLFNFLASHMDRQLRGLGAGSLHEHMRVGDGMKLRVHCPPLSQQDGLVSKIEAGRGRSLRLSALAQRQLGLLAERRQALITAAVTGRFDVPTAGGRDATGERLG